MVCSNVECSLDAVAPLAKGHIIDLSRADSQLLGHVVFVVGGLEQDIVQDRCLRVERALETLILSIELYHMTV